MTDQKSITNLENKIDQSSPLQVESNESKIINIDSVLKSINTEIERENPDENKLEIDVDDWCSVHMKDLKDEVALENFLNEFSDGKHLSNMHIPLVILFESSFSKTIELFLKKMKTEEKTTVGYLKEFYLKMITIMESKEDERQKLILELKENDCYKKLSENIETNKCVQLTMILLLKYNDIDLTNMNITDLIKNKNLIALTILRNEKSNNLVRKIFQRNALDGDVFCYLYFLEIEMDHFIKMSKKRNLFKISHSEDFCKLMKLLPIILEIENIIHPKISFLDDISFFISKFYNASEAVRTFAATIVKKILTTQNFCDKATEIAYKILHRIVDGTDLDTNYTEKHDDPKFFMLLEYAEKHHVSYFVEICENLHRDRYLTKDLNDVISKE
jgi:hypothetical protein